MIAFFCIAYYNMKGCTLDNGNINRGDGNLLDSGYIYLKGRFVDQVGWGMGLGIDLPLLFPLFIENKKGSNS